MHSSGERRADAKSRRPYGRALCPSKLFGLSATGSGSRTLRVAILRAVTLLSRRYARSDARPASRRGADSYGAPLAAPPRTSHATGPRHSLHLRLRRVFQARFVAASARAINVERALLFWNSLLTAVRLPKKKRRL